MWWTEFLQKINGQYPAFWIAESCFDPHVQLLKLVCTHEYQFMAPAFPLLTVCMCVWLHVLTQRPVPLWLVFFLYPVM